jgi:hypothetical protein
MAFELIGIPINEEQCIGDSLPYINGAFAVLSGQLTNLDADIASRYLLKTDFGGFLPLTGGTLTGNLNIGLNNVVSPNAKLTLGKTTGATELGIPSIYCGSTNGASADLILEPTSTNSKVILRAGSASAEVLRATKYGISILKGSDPETALEADMNGLIGIKTNPSGYGLMIGPLNAELLGPNYSRMEFQLDLTGGGVGGRYVAYIGTANAGQGFARDLAFKTQNTEKMRLTVDGKFGVGTASPQKTLHVNGDGLVTGNFDVTGTLKINGNVVATGNVTGFSDSDARLKTNIESITGALDKVSAIGGYNFEWKNDIGIAASTPARGKDVGVLAQEIELVLPEVVQTNIDGYKSVRYDKIIPLLIEAIKELSAEVKALKAAQS